MRTRRMSGWVCAVLAGALLVSLPALGETGEPAADPLRDRQWNLDQIRATEAWDVTRGRGATVAIVDTGIDLDHPDLAENLAPGATFYGCIGDSFFRHSGCGDGDWQSGDSGRVGHFHGTHVGGIVGAVSDNDVGLAGVAPEATLLPVKVCDAGVVGGCNGVTIGRGIRWAVDQGADVVNLSIGQPPGFQLFGEMGTGFIGDPGSAIHYAQRHGVLVVVAAGNDTFPLCQPHAYHDPVLCVAATDFEELPASYTNFPNNEHTTGLSAPGGTSLDLRRDDGCGDGVLSTVPVGTASEIVTELCGYPADRSYDESSGTSFAAPHVAGVGALLVSLGCSAAEATEHILATARNPLSGQRGDYSVVYGAGIVDAAAAAAAAATSCTPPPPNAEPRPVRCGREIRTYGTEIVTWDVETAENESGTPPWSEFTEPLFTGTEMFTVGAGLGRKDDRLVGAPFVATRHTEVDFRHHWELEAGRDGGVLEISTDGGQSWEPVPAEAFVAGGYTGALADGRPAWTGSMPKDRPAMAARFLTGAYVSVVDLSGFAKQEVTLSWRLLQDAQQTDSTPGLGWGLDSLLVQQSADPELCPDPEDDEVE